MGSVYGWQTTGALLGHAVATSLAGLIIYVTDGNYTVVFALSMAFSLGGVLVIANLDSTSHILIPDWEESLPEEARAAPVLRHGRRPTPAPAAASDD